VPDVRRIDGVEDAAPRWQTEASAAYALGQPLRLVAFPRGAEDFEAPPLAEGRRRRGANEAEVGSGLADALGLRPGGTLAVALPTGGEARFRVSGIVRSLENEGRTAYVRSERLEALGALDAPVVAVRLEPGADRAAVGAALTDLGAAPSEAAAATTRDRSFLGVLAAVLRIVALTVALVCLVVLVQALVLTVRERRPTIALLRTTGAGRSALARLLAGRARRSSCPPRCSASRWSGSSSARSSRRWQRATRAVAGPAGRSPRARRARLTALGPWRSRGSGGASRASRSSPGCGRRRELPRAGHGRRRRAGCGGGGLRTRRAGPEIPGSTLRATIVDRDGTGRLAAGPGEALVDRTELAPRGRATRQAARFGQITDLHVRDEESPARVPFLDRLGPPVTSTFRPHEALSPQVLAAAVRSLDAERPQGVLVTGDLVDSAQANEVTQLLGVLQGGMVDPGSGRAGYRGAQAAANPDGFFYRPGLDAPRFPGLLRARSGGSSLPACGRRGCPRWATTTCSCRASCRRRRARTRSRRATRRC
jgi:hypothetical protein